MYPCNSWQRGLQISERYKAKRGVCNKMPLSHDWNSSIINEFNAYKEMAKAILTKAISCVVSGYLKRQRNSCWFLICAWKNLEEERERIGGRFEPAPRPILLLGIERRREIHKLGYAYTELKPRNILYYTDNMADAESSLRSGVLWTKLGSETKNYCFTPIMLLMR